MMQLISHLHIKQPQIEMCGQHPCLIWLEVSRRVKRRNGKRMRRGVIEALEGKQMSDFFRWFDAENVIEIQSKGDCTLYSNWRL